MTSATSAATVTSHANGATRPTTAPRIAHHPKSCGSNIATAIHCKESADKHRIPHPDIEHAIFHPINKHQIEGRRGDVTAGRVQRVGSAHHRDGSRISDDELDAILRGRPSLGRDRATGRGRSARRQVRLPESLNTALDDYAAAHNTTPSAVIRDALEAYLASA
ncbi:ribbon-helix-helix domain-containing protein [Actinomyces marmotae]|uniref:ribbon-helix-helix domain-containing protein n=1 Tax=Actinomyces marmotae TaxID=2737173 RepID=UPI001F40F0DB|nr:ribbon-helix-helix domain-containing protein [Actinomyces marmotae]